MVYQFWRVFVFTPTDRLIGWLENRGIEQEKMDQWTSDQQTSPRSHEKQGTWSSNITWLQAAEATEAEIDTTRAGYKPCGDYTSILFFCISDLVSAFPPPWCVTL